MLTAAVTLENGDIREVVMMKSVIEGVTVTFVVINQCHCIEVVPGCRLKWVRV